MATQTTPVCPASLDGSPLHLSIGEIPLALHVPEGDLRRRASVRYTGFTSPGADGFPIFLEDSALPGAPASRFRYTLHDNSQIQMDRDFAKIFGVRHEYALDSLVRILLSVMLLDRKGFLLHAASVTRNGKAFIFPGRSGAGKSTVASLAPSGSVLTDEISLLSLAAGAWRAHGTPFWGEFRAAGANVSAPVHGVYFLVQAPENRIERMSPGEGLRALLPKVLFFSADRLQTEKLLEILTEAVAGIPFHRLYFRRDPSFWEVLE
ncbi:MAG: hypothetical protein ACRD5L_12075, partial [Bryobacteraceae bacterium]